MTRPLLPIALLFLALLFGGGCGGDEESAGTGGPAPASDPVSQALAHLAGRVEGGEGMSDATWSEDVLAVALALWPVDDRAPAPEALAAHRTHSNLAHIAGDMAVQLSRGGVEAREDWLERDPGSVAIYDAFVTACRAGPDAYRAWVEGDGAALLRKRVEAITGRPPR
ncbi:MAG: hypothetical protein ACYTG6_03005 [Planctomycetota bacterium]|jgi:hypothetical protein